MSEITCTCRLKLFLMRRLLMFGVVASRKLAVETQKYLHFGKSNKHVVQYCQRLIFQDKCQNTRYIDSTRLDCITATQGLDNH